MTDQGKCSYDADWQYIVSNIQGFTWLRSPVIVLIVHVNSKDMPSDMLINEYPKNIPTYPPIFP